MMSQSAKSCYVSVFASPAAAVLDLPPLRFEDSVIAVRPVATKPRAMIRTRMSVSPFPKDAPPCLVHNLVHTKAANHPTQWDSGATVRPAKRQEAEPSKVQSSWQDNIDPRTLAAAKVLGQVPSSAALHSHPKRMT